MSLKEAIREKALELAFEDVGFTSVEPLDLYVQEVESRPPEMDGWVQAEQFKENCFVSIPQKT
jgi:epoxyqueuosine reductase QueG